jgi:copper(I)-binding protein
MFGVVVRRGAGVLVLFSFVLAIACSDEGPKTPEIRIENARAELSPAMLGVASVFMDIVNGGRKADVLTGVSVNVADAVTELHDVKDGRMAPVRSIPVPAGGIVHLRPRGLHIMLFQLPRNLKNGSELKLILAFELSGMKEVAVKIGRESGSHAHGRR